MCLVTYIDLKAVVWVSSVRSSGDICLFDMYVCGEGSPASLGELLLAMG
jgi:hypothetical protein